MRDTSCRSGVGLLERHFRCLTIKDLSHEFPKRAVEEKLQRQKTSTAVDSTVCSLGFVKFPKKKKFGNFESIRKIFGNYLGILVAILNTALHEYSTGINPYTLFSTDVDPAVDLAPLHR